MPKPVVLNLFSHRAGPHYGPSASLTGRTIQTNQI